MNPMELANHGQEALSMLDIAAFDIVLMDVQMPVMNGIDATAAIRHGEKMTGAHIPIVGVTAHALTGDRETCLASGMDGYVTKPIRVEELCECIENLIRTTVAPSETR